MAKRADYLKSWLTLRQQRRGMTKWAPFLSCRIRRGVLLSQGSIRPTPLSRSYEVGIYYRVGYPPTVRVLTPALARHPEWNYIPHLNGDGSLCLYFPNLREWGPHRYIAKTIVPWTALWLFYYEAWLATGGLGGWGGHPAPVDQQEFIDRPRLLTQAAQNAASWEGASGPYQSSLLHSGSRRTLRAITKITRYNAA